MKYQKELEGLDSDYERFTTRTFKEIISDAKDAVLTEFQQEMVVKQINSAMKNFEAFLRAIRKYQL